MRGNDRGGDRGRDRGDFKPRFGGGGGGGGGFRNDFNRSFSSGPREMHKAVCADCGAECEVPFEPKEGRPVYCRECFPKHKPQRF